MSAKIYRDSELDEVCHRLHAELTAGLISGEYGRPLYEVDRPSTQLHALQLQPWFSNLKQLSTQMK